MNTTPDHVTRERAAHHAALESLATNGEPGMKLWRKLRRIEHEARDAATAQWNGEAYNGQPFRSETEWEEFKAAIGGRVALVFGRTHLHPPAGFFVNDDPRGCALKLAPEKGAIIPPGMYQDWGGYGIMAPVIE